MTRSKIKITTITLFFALISFFNAEAQVLDLEKIIELALAHNHQIKIVKSQNQIAKNNNSYGNANLLPKVDLNGGISTSKSKADIEFANQPEPITDAESESYSENLSVNLSYTLFSGFGNIRTYQKLQTLTELSEAQTRMTIESTLISVINSYYELLRIQEQIKTLQLVKEISKDRLHRLKANYTYGAVSRIDFLNAEVDFNADSSALLSSTLLLQTAQHNLNYLIGNPPGALISISETDTLLSEISTIDEYTKLATENNVNLLVSQMNIKLSEKDQKISQSRYSPVIIANLNYGYSSSESAPSVVLSSSSLGYTGSVNLAWNLFDGSKKRTALKNAKIMLDNNTIAQDQAKLNVSRELLNYHDAYLNSVKIHGLEKHAVKTAQLNLNRSRELLQNGSINNTQFRLAQLALVNARTKEANAYFQGMITFYQIKRLTGQLIQ